jgi:hypothetical protein
VPLRVTAGIASTAHVVLLDVQDFRAGCLGVAMMLIRIVDHEVAALHVGHGKVRRSGIHAEIARRQQHDDVVAKREVRLQNRAVYAGDDTDALEAEGAAQPIDSCRDVAITKGRHKPRGRIGACRHCSIPHTATITRPVASRRPAISAMLCACYPRAQEQSAIFG